MKLIIKRDQKAKTGLLGGHKGMTFVLKARMELTADELELVKRYKMEYHPLTFRTRDGMQTPSETVTSLTQGVEDEVQDITVLLNNEDVYKNACKDFKVLLDVMATFGGEEVIEF